MIAFAAVLRAFLLWFNGQPAYTRRALVQERALAYVDHPIVSDVLAACPPDVRQAAEHLIATIRRSDWKG